MTCPACGATNRAAARFCDSCGGALAAGTGVRRKVVTVLFCDVVGSTALGESIDRRRCGRCWLATSTG